MIVEAHGWAVTERSVIAGENVVRPVEFFAFVPQGDGRQGFALAAIAIVLIDGELRACTGKLSRTA